jgi:DNA-binding GntR family transcriptional regulator
LPRRRRQQRQLSEEAAVFIRESIMSGRIRGGEYVRVAPIAQELELSATPVREALHLLRSEGFVELEPNRGFRVREMTSGDIADVFDLHAMVAGQLAARAANQVTSEELTILERIQQGLVRSSARKRWSEVDELNNQFHQLINRTAQAPLLLNFVRQLNHYVPRRFFGTIAGWPEASLHDHAAILDALKRRDPKTADKAMSAHMRHAGELLAANLWGERE